MALRQEIVLMIMLLLIFLHLLRALNQACGVLAFDLASHLHHLFDVSVFLWHWLRWLPLCGWFWLLCYLSLVYEAKIMVLKCIKLKLLLLELSLNCLVFFGGCVFSWSLA